MAAPTCKVVNREGETGARIYPKGCKVRTEVGPKNPTAETLTDRSGIKKYRKNKQGTEKYVSIEKSRTHFIIVVSPEQKIEFEQAEDDVKRTLLHRWWGVGSQSRTTYIPGTEVSERARFGPHLQVLVYDTGAQGSSVGFEHMLDMGFKQNEGGNENWVGPNGTVYNRANGSLSSISITGVSGPSVLRQSLHNVPLCCIIFKNAVTPADTKFLNLRGDISIQTERNEGLFGVDMIQQIKKRLTVKFKRDFIEIAD